MIIHPEVIDLVESKYHILETINLYDYDSNPDSLFALFKKYQDYTFNPNERILILHHDTDYYIQNTPGFTLYNLILILSHLFIPGEFLIMLTNHYGIETEVNLQYKLLSGLTPLKVIYTSLWYDFPFNYPPAQPKSQNPETLFCCLNGIQRHHRMILLCFLKEKGLLNKGMISYNFGIRHA